MSDREDIEPNEDGWRRLSYTCRCGWVDWGHALPGAANTLKRMIDTETSEWPRLSDVPVSYQGEPAYILDFGMEMSFKSITVSPRNHWVVRKGLDQLQKQRVALGIYLAASHDFERLQGSFPFSLVTGASSFSPEDLVSNLIGFVRAYNGYDHVRMRAVCGEVSVAESYRIWDEHLPQGFGGLKNRTMKPIYFPSRECGASPGDTSFPQIISQFRAEPSGRNWVRLRGLLDGRLANTLTPIHVDGEGNYRPQ